MSPPILLLFLFITGCLSFTAHFNVTYTLQCPGNFRYEYQVDLYEMDAIYNPDDRVGGADPGISSGEVVIGKVFGEDNGDELGSIQYHLALRVNHTCFDNHRFQCAVYHIGYCGYFDPECNFKPVINLKDASILRNC